MEDATQREEEPQTQELAMEETQANETQLEEGVTTISNTSDKEIVAGDTVCVVSEETQKEETSRASGATQPSEETQLPFDETKEKKKFVPEDFFATAEAYNSRLPEMGEMERAFMEVQRKFDTQLFCKGQTIGHSMFQYSEEIQTTLKRCLEDKGIKTDFDHKTKNMKIMF